MALERDAIIRALKRSDFCPEAVDCVGKSCKECIGEQLQEYECMVASLGLYKFVGDLEDAARANWCPAQVDMLERLVGSIIDNVPYDEWQRKEPANEQSVRID